MKPVSGRRMCQVLKQHGWITFRISSSHYLLSHSGFPRQVVSVPVHGNRDLATGTQRGIMRQAGLTNDDL